ncbi:hypothetical protein WICMUC_005138 [Wickerhamomyces mucosus]|uniref:Transcription regulator Rua1 C-terminal domain-containing protein n=1 Tax=Wickerhamomyces mucosus TaxID=1378264 RepID=A0A9P8T793_9ASCO|nr:hypothetical protein WICMUC_005138 [Wickerhamomyces mucosus]
MPTYYEKLYKFIETFIFNNPQVTSDFFNIHTSSSGIPQVFASSPYIFLEYWKVFFPDTPLPGRILENPTYMENDNLYNSSNVCYFVQEKYKGIIKTNKETLCPLCDVFSNGKIPRFYNSLGSGYPNHMKTCHGIKRNDSSVVNPFVGISRSSIAVTDKEDFKLTCICPYTDPEGVPCLSEFKLNLGSNDGNPFKAYIRHVEKFHNSERKERNYSIKGNYLAQKAKEHRYSSKLKLQTNNGDLNYFIPLNLVDCFNSYLFLKDSCKDKALNLPFVTLENEYIRNLIDMMIATLDNTDFGEISQNELKNEVKKLDGPNNQKSSTYEKDIIELQVSTNTSDHYYTYNGNDSEVHPKLANCISNNAQELETIPKNFQKKSLNDSNRSIGNQQHHTNQNDVESFLFQYSNEIHQIQPNVYNENKIPGFQKSNEDKITEVYGDDDDDLDLKRITETKPSDLVDLSDYNSLFTEPSFQTLDTSDPCDIDDLISQNDLFLSSI